MKLSVCLSGTSTPSVYRPSVYLLICMSVDRPVLLSVFKLSLYLESQTDRLSVVLSVCGCLSICLSVCVSLSISVCIFVSCYPYLSVCIPVCASLCLRPSFCRYLCPSLLLPLSVSLSVSPCPGRSAAGQCFILSTAKKKTLPVSI